jgi:CubicO group peptidase (beta-lactamase class C family)
MAKSFTSTLVGIAIERGDLSGVDELICTYYDAWDCGAAADPRGRIDLAAVLTLTSGLDWTEDWSSGISLANDAIAMSGMPRPIDYVLAKPAAAEPRTQFQYSTGDPALLSGVLEAVTGKSAYDFGQEVLFSVIGISGVSWNSDADGRTTTFAGLSATAREYAKFGFLFLNRGNWDGTQVVSESWVDVATNPGESLEDWYGYLWHVNAPVKWDNPELPADGFAAIGVQGQHIFVVPSADLVVVRLAEDGFGPNPDFDAGTLLGHVLAAVK